MDSDPELATALADRTRFARFVHLEECDSTQAEAAAAEGAAVIWSDHQRAGRGRKRAVWHDSRALDLAVSFRVPGLSLTSPIHLGASLPAVVAMAIAETTGVRAKIKWPNDLLVGGRKLSGILSDGGGDGIWLLGIGVNVNSKTFPPELAGRATSLALITGREWDIRLLLLGIADTLEACLADLEAGHSAPWARAFEEALDVVGREMRLVSGGRQVIGIIESADLNHITLRDGSSYELATVQTLRPV